MATVIDLGSRRVVGWATADHLRTDLIDHALTNAITSRRPDRGVIFHSDRGSSPASSTGAWPTSTACACQSAGAVNVGTTPSPSRSTLGCTRADAANGILTARHPALTRHAADELDQGNGSPPHNTRRPSSNVCDQH